MKKLPFGFRVVGVGLAGLSALTAFSSLSGCSSSSSSSPNVDTSQVDSFIQSMAQAQCAWEYNCCKDAEIKALEGSKYTTKEACLPYQQLTEEDALYLERLAVREGRITVDTTHAAACLSQQTSRMCNAAPGMPQPTPPAKTDDCALVFVGTTAVGAECIYANECVTGAHCVSDAAAVGRGVCVPFQKSGDICNTDNDCDPSVDQIYCAKQDFKCHVRGKVGDACAYTTDTSGTTSTLPMLLECDQSTTTPQLGESSVYCDPTSKTCMNLPGDGQSCLTTLPPGVGSRCNPDPTLMLVCDNSTGPGPGTGPGTCRAPGKVGADCTSLPCAADLFCMRNGAASVCTALPGLGQDCVMTNGQCAKPYFCNFSKTPQAVCDQPAMLGQDCTQVGCNTGLYCDQFGGATRVCKTQLADGAACMDPQQCTSLDCSGAPSVCQAQQVAAVCSGR